MSALEGCFSTDAHGRPWCSVCDVEVPCGKNTDKAIHKHVTSKEHKKMLKKTGGAPAAHGGKNQPVDTLSRAFMAVLGLDKSGKKAKKDKKDKGDKKPARPLLGSQTGKGPQQQAGKGGAKGAAAAAAAAAASAGSMFASRLSNQLLWSMADHVPVRLDEHERRLLRLVDGALDISEYTDVVDVAANMMGYGGGGYGGRSSYAGGATGANGRIVDQLKEIFQLFIGLELTSNFKHGCELGQGAVKDDAKFYQHMFEVRVCFMHTH
jgi:hypothetical protein